MGDTNMMKKAAAKFDLGLAKVVSAKLSIFATLQCILQLEVFMGVGQDKNQIFGTFCVLAFELISC